MEIHGLTARVGTVHRAEPWGERVTEPGWGLLPSARHGRVVKVEEMNRGFSVPLLPHFGSTELVKCRLQRHRR